MFATWVGIACCLLSAGVSLVGAAACHGSNFTVSVIVPQPAARFHNAELICEFNGADGVDAVRWYKNGSEIFRFIPLPRDRHWKKGFLHHDVTVLREHSDLQKMTLQNVDLSAQGKYHCEVVCGVPPFARATGEGELTVTGHVNAGESRNVSIVVPHTAEDQSSVELECHFRDSGVDKVRWLKDGEEFFRYVPGRLPVVSFLEGIHVVVESSGAHIVTLQRVSALTQGFYRCEVNWKAPYFSSVSVIGRLKVLGPACSRKSANVSVEVPQIAEENSDVQLSCMYNEVDPYNVKWFKDGNVFFEFITRPGRKEPEIITSPVDGVNVLVSSSSEHSVALHRVSSASRGVYRCEIVCDEESESTVGAEGRLMVAGPDGVNMSVSVPQFTALYRDAELLCNYLLGPDVISVRWYKDGRRFFEFRPHDKFPQEVFNVTDVTVVADKSDAHQVTLRRVETSAAGMYRCVVSRGAPSFQTSMAEGQLQVVSFSVNVIVPQDIARNAAAELHCQYTVGDVFSVSWFKDGVEFFQYRPDAELPVRVLPLSGVSIAIDLQNTSPRLLRLVNLDVSAQGVYRCEVTRNAPSSARSMDEGLLTVVGSACTGNSSFNVSLVLPSPAVHMRHAELNCQYDGLHGVRAVHWYKDDEEFFRYMPQHTPPTKLYPVDGISVLESHSNAHMVTLPNVQYSADGSYRCLVECEGDSGMHASASAEDRLSVVGAACHRGSFNVTVVVPKPAVKDSEAELKCEFDGGDGVSAVRWFKGNREFYRYIPLPDGSHWKKSFPHRDVNVTEEKSSLQKVVIRNVNESSQGVYKCEVVCEVSPFTVATAENNLTVIDAGELNVKVSVPQTVQKERKASLVCQYNEDYLQSFSWFKDGREFYRYRPEEELPIQISPQSVFSVVLDNSHLNELKLENITPYGAGSYRCEVDFKSTNASASAEGKVMSVARQK